MSPLAPAATTTAAFPPPPSSRPALVLVRLVLLVEAAAIPLLLDRFFVEALVLATDALVRVRAPALLALPPLPPFLAFLLLLEAVVEAVFDAVEEAPSSVPPSSRLLADRFFLAAVVWDLVSADESVGGWDEVLAFDRVETPLRVAALMPPPPLFFEPASVMI